MKIELRIFCTSWEGSKNDRNIKQQIDSRNPKSPLNRAGKNNDTKGKMKKVSLMITVALVAVIMITSCGGGASNETSTSNEASFPNELTIGDQIWMIENLNVDKFRNGDPIPHAQTVEEWEVAAMNGQPAWCYYDNNPDNGERYGKLYNWYAVNDPRGLAPEGWKVASDEDWNRLADFLGGQLAAGEKMKIANFLAANDGDSGSGTNESGFSGLPGGARGRDGSFKLLGEGGYWWSSTEYNTDIAWYRHLYYEVGPVYWDNSYKGSGMSVRCLRD